MCNSCPPTRGSFKGGQGGCPQSASTQSPSKSLVQYNWISAVKTVVLLLSNFQNWICIFNNSSAVAAIGNRARAKSEGADGSPSNTMSVDRDLPSYQVVSWSSHIFYCACAKTAILADIYSAGSLLPEIIMILFTQSTALHKYWIVLKLFYLL